MIDLITQSSIPASSCHPNISLPSPKLPSNPIAFDLNAHLSLPGPYDRPSIATLYCPGPASSRDLDQLHLNALMELQKSIVENGEGFVDKMRDWEIHRGRDEMARGGLKRPRSTMTCKTSGPMDDSDAVMNLDSAPDEEVYFQDSPRKKHALSVETVDALDAVPTPSALTDDTESDSRNSISAAPPSYPDIPSSYPDKAVSALTLAFASGACGINDYPTVLDAYNHTHYGEESHVGKLWD